MAAPWRIWTRDYAAGLVETGSSGQAGFAGDWTTAANAGDPDLTGVTLTGTGSNRDLDVNLGASRSIQGLLLANQTLQGATVTLFRGATFGAVTTTVYGPTAIPAAADRDFLIDFTEVASQFWTLRVATGSTGYQVGRVGFLGGASDGTMFAMTTAGTPERNSISRGMRSGVVRIPSAGGSPVSQVVEGVRERLAATLQYLDASESGALVGILASYRATNGWPYGIVVTDDVYDDTNHRGKAYLGELQGDLDGRHVAAGPRASLPLDLLTFSRGIA